MRLPTEIQDAVDGLASRWSRYAAYQAWYDGEHGMRPLLERLPIRHESLKEALCDLSENLCPLVVDTLADRLHLDGVDAPGYENQVSDILRRARIDAFQGEVHKRVGTQGDGYVLVWEGDDKKARFHFHEASDMAVIRDANQPDRLYCALKLFSDRDEQNKPRVRLNVFYADRVEKFYKRQSTAAPTSVLSRVWDTFFGSSNVPRDWEPFDGQGGPVLPNPLGIVPVAVFNNARYRAEGVSELHNVVGLQRMLDKSLIDLAIGSEANGVPNRWVVGLDFDIDPTTGKPKHEFDPKDIIWAFGGKPEDLNLGQFNAADLQKMAQGPVATYRESIARVSRTPLHYLGDQKGGWPSGEALKTAEAAFTAKCARRQAEFGEPWEDAVRFALMWEAGVKPDLTLEAKWKDTRPRHEVEHWQAKQTQHDLGKSKREIWREEGFSEAEINKMFAEGKDEGEAEVDALARTFASGGQVTE